MSRRRARSLPKGRSIPVVIRADPARKRRWSALIEIVDRAKREQASGFDAYWEAVAEIVDHGLYAGRTSRRGATATAPAGETRPVVSQKPQA